MPLFRSLPGGTTAGDCRRAPERFHRAAQNSEHTLFKTRVTVFTLVSLVSCSGNTPNAGANGADTPTGSATPCAGLTQVQVQTLGRPPSTRPALVVEPSSATGRVVVGGGEYGPYDFVVAHLAPSDWVHLRDLACVDRERYPGVTSTGGGKVGGDIYVELLGPGAAKSSLVFDAGSSAVDPLVAALRALAVKYFASATF